MILILTAAEDEHADAVEAHLRIAGADYLRFDPGRFPAEATMSIRVDGRGVTRTLTVDGHSRDLDEVGVVWVRRPNRPQAPASAQDSAIGDVVGTESEMFTVDAWETLDVPHVPAGQPTLQRARYKIRQLQLAARLGFDIPDTVVGNDPEALLSMYAGGRQLVTKRLGSEPLGRTPDGTASVGRYTQPVRPRDLLHASSLRLCPVIIQAYVPKRVELRVTVVGDEVFAAAIHSQHSRRTRYDWRHYDHRTTPMEEFDLPGQIAQRCRVLVRTLGLRYGAIDLVLTPDGRYVFLEVNPNGQYLWLEQEVGLPISAALARLLVEIAARGRAEIAPSAGVEAT
jgi:glutathione synthase/RimK-type ligase-like ATP-grasp enzyme